VSSFSGADPSKEQDLEYAGIGGWLLVPIANLVLIVVSGIYLLNNGRSAFEPIRYVLIGLIVYCLLCLALTFLRYKLAKFLLILFYAVAFITDVGIGMIMKAHGQFDLVQFMSALVRGIIELLLLCYFIMSVRVRQTLIK